jgi:5-formyltetrahydrofolate cyclo-ligase
VIAPAGELDVVELRRRLRARRRSLDFPTQRDHSYAAASQSPGVPEITTATTAGVYLADDGELDPRPVIELLVNRSAVVHLPVVDEDDVMRFRAWDTVSPLIEGRWGIPVPADPSQTRSAEELDVVIAPLVAVDRHGTRIGRGAGYYDRTLAHRLERGGRPAIIGYAHHLQLVDGTLPRHVWDVPLDVLVTEEATLRWTEP